MKSEFHDPNNHVPEVTDADEWGDLDAEPAKPDLVKLEPRAALPAKKRAAEEAPVLREIREVKAHGLREVKADPEKGLEIGVKVVEKAKPAAETKHQVQRLEVQEHVAKKPLPELQPAPKVVPKLVAEKIAPSEIVSEEEWLPRAPDAENWGRQKSIPMRWIVISGSVLAVLIVGLAVLLPRMRWKDEQRTTSFFRQIEVDDAPMVPKATGDAENFETGGRQLALKYARAKTVEELLPFLRDAGKIEPLVRSHWQPMNLPANWKIPDEFEWSTLTSGEREYAVLAGVLPDLSRCRFYFVREAGRVVLDWEATTAYSETSYEDLSKNQGAGGKVRGFISPGDFYTFSLPEKEYQCFRISSPDSLYAIWGYVRRETPEAVKLFGLFQQGAIPRDIPAEYQITVKLAPAPPESTANQWLITEMLHIDWLTP